MNGHFKSINCVKFRPNAVGNILYLLTGSDDFSVRLWDAFSGLQLMLFLDIQNQNSEVVSLDWTDDGTKFLSLDVNQNLKIWTLQTDKVREHLKGCE